MQHCYLKPPALQNLVMDLLKSAGTGAYGPEGRRPLDQQLLVDDTVDPFPRPTENSRVEPIAEADSASIFHDDGVSPIPPFVHGRQLGR
eukprot:4584999-Amphidinium_carterae.1